MSSQDLSTTKYWNASVKQELKELRRERNRQALGSFAMLLFTIAVMIGVFFAIQTMPQWLPTAVEFLDSRDWMPVLQGKI